MGMSSKIYLSAPITPSWTKNSKSEPDHRPGRPKLKLALYIPVYNDEEIPKFQGTFPVIK